MSGRGSTARGLLVGALATLAVATAMLAVTADEGRAQSWRGWNAYWENDSFVAAGSSDDAFTNGVRLAVGRDPNAADSWMDFLADWLDGHALFGRDPEQGSDATWSLVVGQNFFTPREITTYSVDPTDRPYAGLWYVGLRADRTERPAQEPILEGELTQHDFDLNRFTRPTPFQSIRQHSLELDVGVLGQGAGGGEVQSAVHAAFSTHRIPKGWPHQMENAPAITGLYMIRQRIGTRNVDITPHGGLLAGTVQTYPFVGATVRVGMNLLGFPAQLGRQTATGVDLRPDWELGLVAGAEGRYFVHNGFVEGPWWDDDPGIEPVRPMGDYRLGLFLRLEDWRFDYTFVRRSPEVDEEGPSELLYDNYGSVSVSYQPGPDARPGSLVDRVMDDWLGTVFDDFILEAGMGTDLRDDDEDGVVGTHGLHVAVGRALPGRFHDLDVAYEMIGVGREFGPPPTPGGDHLDRFLVNHLFTLRYRPWGGRVGPGVAHVRAGIGRSQMELEATPDVPGERTRPCPPRMGPSGTQGRACHFVELGTGYLLGGGYALDFGHDLGLNLDLAWNQVDSDDPFEFLAWSLGFQWAPR